MFTLNNNILNIITILRLITNAFCILGANLSAGTKRKVLTLLISSSFNAMRTDIASHETSSISLKEQKYPTATWINIGDTNL